MIMMIGMNTFTAVGLFAVLGAMLLGLLSTYPAVKASENGGNFLKWYLFSFFLFPIALIAVFKRKSKTSKNGTGKCRKLCDDN